MSILNILTKCLKENQSVSNWLINEISVVSYESFYVLQKQETKRIANTLEYQVTVYHDFSEGEKAYTGSSSFVVSHELNKKEAAALIEQAVYASKFVKNPAYKIVENNIKKSYKEKELAEEPFVVLDKIASLFFANTKATLKFNALETFLKRRTVHVINSCGVNLKKTINSIFVEAIPSFDGTEKVELYKSYNYHDIDYAKVEEDVKNALADTEKRYYATKIEDVKNIDVILRESEARAFFEALIENYSFADVVKGSTDKKLGDMIQSNPKGEALTISLQAPSKYDCFDNDGAMARNVTVIDNGKLVSYYGNNRFAYYLKETSTGNAEVVTVNKGKVSAEKMFKKPHIEIIALSGIQIEMYSGYIGGEVRLANYFDGEKNHPISGFSFSGKIENCLNNLVLSKETTKINYYQGPKFVKLPEMEIL